MDGVVFCSIGYDASINNQLNAVYIITTSLVVTQGQETDFNSRINGKGVSWIYSDITRC